MITTLATRQILVAGFIGRAIGFLLAMQSTTPHPTKAKTQAGGVGAPWNLYVAGKSDAILGFRHPAGGVLSQFRAAIRIKLQSSECSSRSFHQGGSQSKARF
jgi:hypothetical protein